MRVKILTAFIMLCGIASVGMLCADNGQPGGVAASSEAIKAAQKLYELDKTRQQIRDYRANGLAMIRDRILNRPEHLRKRSWKSLPLEFYRPATEDSPACFENYGPDLIEPDPKWIALKATSNVAVPIDEIKVVGFEVKNGVQCAILFHPKWPEQRVDQFIYPTREFQAVVIIPGLEPPPNTEKPPVPESQRPVKTPEDVMPIPAGPAKSKAVNPLPGKGPLSLHEDMKLDWRSKWQAT